MSQNNFFNGLLEDDVLDELVSDEEQRAIDVVMNSRMPKQHKAETIKKVRDGEMTPTQAIEMTRNLMAGRKQKGATGSIRE